MNVDPLVESAAECVTWQRAGFPKEIKVAGRAHLLHSGAPHASFLNLWGKDKALLRPLGFDMKRPDGRWIVTFSQPIDSEAHAYFPSQRFNEEEDKSPPTLTERISCFVQKGREYEIAEIVEAMTLLGYANSEVTETLLGILTDGIILKTLPNGRVCESIPF